MCELWVVSPVHTLESEWWQASMKTDNLFISQLHNLLGGQKWNSLFCQSLAWFCSFAFCCRVSIRRLFAKFCFKMLAGCQINGAVVQLAFHVIPQDLRSCSAVHNLKLGKRLDS